MQGGIVDLLRGPGAAALASAALAVSMFVLAYVAHRASRRHRERSGGGSDSFAVISGAVFALFGLLVAFTFNGAYSRYELRRQLIIEETNAIGTAALRVDTLPEPQRTAMLREMRTYARNRAEFFPALTDRGNLDANVREGQRLQHQLWSLAIDASARPGDQLSRLSILPALNDMFDIATRRSAAAIAHPPAIVFVMLFVLGLACAWLTGYGAGKQEKLSVYYAGFFAVVTGFMFYVILDIEFPSAGLVNLSEANQFLQQTQAALEETDLPHAAQGAP